MYTQPYSCMETCGQEKHCGNRYCSAHPHYFGPKTKKSKKEGTPFQRRRTSPRSYVKRKTNNRPPKIEFPEY